MLLYIIYILIGTIVVTVLDDVHEMFNDAPTKCLFAAFLWPVLLAVLLGSCISYLIKGKRK